MDCHVDVIQRVSLKAEKLCRRLSVLLGWRVRWFARGSAVLLFLFTAMTISGLSQFSYGVYALSTGVWALSTVDTLLISVDSITRRRAET